ncbi:MAG: helix-turn-helix transcriptional regulator [Actinomycetota bacterium]|nr:helix-turn-helix transcriptional regulator [Actinomycetota bacterium]
MGVEKAVRPRFGQSLRQRRFDLGWTQGRLAAAMGVPPSDIARWERGESLPSLATIRVAARVLGTRPERARIWLEQEGEAASAASTAGGEHMVHLETYDPPADPFERLGVRKTKPPQRRDPGSAEPARGARSGLVFPEYTQAVVYSSGPLPVTAPGLTLGRFTRTSAVLIALGVVLWWAFGQLGTVL